jgi:hypothetical protein
MTKVCTANAGMAHLLNIRMYGMRRPCRTLERIGLNSKIRARQSASAVVLGKLMSVEGIARVTL